MASSNCGTNSTTPNGTTAKPQNNSKTEEEEPVGKLLTHETYLTPRQPGSFGGVDAIFNALKVQRPNLPVAFKKDIRKWLSEKDAYTLHKPVRSKFPRRRYVTSGIDCLWQADLVDVSNIVEFNDGYRFMLVCIDVFSKYA